MYVLPNKFKSRLAIYYKIRHIMSFILSKYFYYSVKEKREKQMHSVNQTNETDEFVDV